MTVEVEVPKHMFISSMFFECIACEKVFRRKVFRRAANRKEDHRFMYPDQRGQLSYSCSERRRNEVLLKVEEEFSMFLRLWLFWRVDIKATSSHCPSLFFSHNLFATLVARHNTKTYLRPRNGGSPLPKNRRQQFDVPRSLRAEKGILTERSKSQHQMSVDAQVMFQKYLECS